MGRIASNGRALSVSIFRCGRFGDFTNRGVTSPGAGHHELLVVGATVSGYLEVSPEERERGFAENGTPIVELVPGAMPGIAVLKPLSARGSWTMFGGNYASTSDSRFGEAIEAITGARFYGAVPVHDRIEG
jgi:hypothetical protein